MSKAKTTRIQQALSIRDAAISLMRTSGQMTPLPDGKHYLTWDGFGFSLLLRTPFQPRQPVPPEVIRAAVQYGLMIPKQMNYGLDIWRFPGGKRLNIEWDHEGEVRLVSFRRGEWETEILKLASDLASHPNEKRRPHLAISLADSTDAFGHPID